MAKFQGEYEVSIDEKNRVVLPSGLRKALSDEDVRGGFTLAIGKNGRCLELHPMQEWSGRIDRLMDLYPEGDEEAEEYLRDVLSSAFDVFPDKQNRFVIPEVRRADAGIDREVVFIGLWNRIEIWDKEAWQARRNERRGKQAPPVAGRAVAAQE